MSNNKFVDVKSIRPLPAALGDGANENFLIRDFFGELLEGITVLPDGTFQGRFGKIRREDLGEYVIRVIGHPIVAKLDSENWASA